MQEPCGEQQHEHEQDVALGDYGCFCYIAIFCFTISFCFHKYHFYK